MRGFLLPKNGLTETDFTIWSIPMRVTISAPDPGCVEFATRALNAFIKGRGNGEFPNPSGAISNSFFGAECTEKPNGNYSIKCWRIPNKLAEAA